MVCLATLCGPSILGAAATNGPAVSLVHSHRVATGIRCNGMPTEAQSSSDWLSPKTLMTGTIVGLVSLNNRRNRQPYIRYASQIATLGRLEVSSAAQGLLSKPKTLLPQRRQLELQLVDFTTKDSVLDQAMPITVVDCGSGSTRAIFFKEQPNLHSSFPDMRPEKSDWRGEALASALQDDEQVNRLLDLLSENVPHGQVLLGATAGVRHAVKVGEVDATQLTRFAGQLRKRLGDRANFTVLTGREEARAEWAATLHALSTRSGQIDFPPLHCGGMFSGGGMSCQIVLNGVEGLQFHSFDNYVLAPCGLAARAATGPLSGAELLDGIAKCEATISRALQSVQRVDTTTIALIEWFGNYIAGNATDRDVWIGLGYERLLPKQKIMDALDKHLDVVRPNRGDISVPRPAAVAMVYGTVIRTVLNRVFADNVKFYCLNGVNWATGHYLLAKQAEAQPLYTADAPFGR